MRPIRGREGKGKGTSTRDRPENEAQVRLEAVRGGVGMGSSSAANRRFPGNDPCPQAPKREVHAVDVQGMCM